MMAGVEDAMILADQFVFGKLVMARNFSFTVSYGALDVR